MSVLIMEYINKIIEYNPLSIEPIIIHELFDELFVIWKFYKLYFILCFFCIGIFYYFKSSRNYVRDFQLNAEKIKIDILEMKCFICNNFLSVPPICQVYSSEGLKQKCGRCQGTPDNQFRNIFFENVAKNCTFPCIFENCQENIPWSKVTEHESICPFRKMSCPLGERCIKRNIALNITDLDTHIKRTHKKITQQVKDVITLPIVTIDETTLKLHNLKLLQRVLHIGKSTFLLFIYKNWFIVTTIERQNLFSKFSIKFHERNADIDDNFKTGKQEICMLQTHCIKCLTGKVCTDESHILKKMYQLHENPGSIHVDMKNIISVIENKNIDVTIELSAINIREENVQLQKIRDKLICPICCQYLFGPIYLCFTGHSICENCRFQMRHCPMCRTRLGESRNYILEDLIEDLKLPCLYRKYGCKIVEDVVTLITHEIDCPNKTKS